MRIISGSAGRRKIKVPKAVLRPTTDRTREAVFSILSQLVDGARCLDLFAGSGAVGMEALSRGAAECTFVEMNRACARVVEENLKVFGLGGGKVVQADAIQFVKRLHGEFDLVFADPPYKKGPADRDFVRELLESDGLQGAMAEGGLFVGEVDSSVGLAEVEGWEQVDVRKYGGCAVYFLRRSA